MCNDDRSKARRDHNGASDEDGVVYPQAESCPHYGTPSRALPPDHRNYPA